MIENEARIVMAGAGMISRHHLLAWRKLAGRARIVGIYDPDLDRARERAGEFGIETVAETLDGLFALPDLAAIDIAAPRQTHADWVRAAVARGLPALCQKPLTPTLAEGSRLLAELPPGARVMVHENWRFRPWYRLARRWLDEGAIGPVLLGRITVLSSFMLPDESGKAPAFIRQPFMAIEERLMIAEILIHHLDLMRFLCGELRLRMADTRRTRSEIRGETLASIMLEADSGATISVIGTMTAPGLPIRPCERLELVGERGTIIFDDWRLSLLGPERRSHAFDPDAGYQQSFDEITAHFLDGLVSGADFETDITDNIETLRLVEHAYQADARRRSAIPPEGRRS